MKINIFWDLTMHYQVANHQNTCNYVLQDIFTPTIMAASNLTQLLKSICGFL
jgi:hypothetical protein